jgi:4-hydroxy-tetrahydrodipicolinate reductase
MIRVVVMGAGGKIGGLIIFLIFATDGMEVAGAVELRGHPSVGKDVGEVAGLVKTDIVIQDDLRSCIRKADVIIDFTDRGESIHHLRMAAQNNIPIVIGTKGLLVEDMVQIQNLSKDTRCVLAPYVGLDLRYLRGAIRAAVWAIDQPNGLYDMQDIPGSDL